MLVRFDTTESYSVLCVVPRNMCIGKGQMHVCMFCFPHRNVLCAQVPEKG